MKELSNIEVEEKCDLIFIEMESGFHLAVDASYLEQVGDFKMKLPTGETLDTSKL